MVEKDVSDVKTKGLTETVDFAKAKTVKQFDRFISEEEFDNHMSTEYRMAKTIVPSMINYDPRIFESPAIAEGKYEMGSPSTYTQEERIRACIIHTCTGSISKTSNMTGIAYQTLNKWRNEGPWWPVIRQEVEKIRNDILVAKLDEVIEEATDAMLDRIKNGDEVYNHTNGETVRVKVKLTDLASGALKVATEKRNELRGMETMGSTKKDVVEHLRKLAGAFEEIAKGMGKRIGTEREGDIVDGEVISTTIDAD